MDRYFIYLLGSLLAWPILPFMFASIPGFHLARVNTMLWAGTLWSCIILACVMYYKYVSMERNGLGEYITYLFGTVVGFFLTLSIIYAVAVSIWGWGVTD